MKLMRATAALLGGFLAAEAGRLRQSALQHGTAGSDLRVQLQNFDNVQYSGSFSLGSQSLPVIYDTGSFEIIVLSTLCKPCLRTGLPAYDSSHSSSFTSSGGVSSEHLFGSGSVFSQQGFESVHIGQPSSPYAASHMSFWQVVSHQIPVWNSYAHFSGIVGLGHTSTVPSGYGSHDHGGQTLLASVGANSFAFCMERSHQGAPGWLVFGPGVDAQASNFAAFDHIPVVGQVHWGIRMTSLEVGDSGIPNPCYPSCGAIVDSGTSLICAPTSQRHVVERIEAMVASDCSNLHTLPILRFRLGDGALVELPPRAYVVQMNQRVMLNSTSLSGRSRDASQSQCAAAFMLIDKNSQHGPVWILGMSFLRYYYTIFDRSAKKIRIAKSSPNCQAPATANIGYSNFTGGVHLNITHMHAAPVTGPAASGPTGGRRVFDASDYTPEPVDLNEARAPAWALGGGADLSF